MYDIGYLTEFVIIELSGKGLDKEGVKKLFNHCFINNAYSDDEHKKIKNEYPEIIKRIDDDYTVKNNKFKENKPRLDGDGDRCNVVFEVYKILWENLYSSFLKLEISADTLCTRDIICGIGNNKIKKYSNCIEEAERFRLKYETLGNFMPLPNKIEGKTCTINNKRGIGILKDQFDVYLMAVKLFYDFYDNKAKFDEKDKDKYKKVFESIELFEEEGNKKYYDNIYSTFEKFIEENYLQDYINEENFAIKVLFKRDENDKEELKESEEILDYLLDKIENKKYFLPQDEKQIKEYLKNATQIIEKRAKRMEKEFWKKIKNKHDNI